MNTAAATASNDPLEEYPDAQRHIVRAALHGAFGGLPLTAITPITGGATTALKLRVDVGGRSYLLRVEGKPSPLRNPYQYQSMRIAAGAGIAPKIRYLDELARVVVMDFIEGRSLQDYPGGRPALARALGGLLRRLQTVRAFPQFVDYPDIVTRLFAHVRRSGRFAPGLLDRHVEHLEDIRQRYASGLQRLVASHNDLHPGNVLFDGQRLWLIDWESAYRSDPLVDVAITLDSFAFSAELRDICLYAWLGRTPDQALHDRLKLVRALTRLYFAGVFLSASAASQSATAPDGELSAPSVAGFASSSRTTQRRWPSQGLPRPTQTGRVAAIDEFS